MTYIGELCVCNHKYKAHKKAKHCTIRGCHCKKYYSQYASMEH